MTAARIVEIHNSKSWFSYQHSVPLIRACTGNEVSCVDLGGSLFVRSPVVVDGMTVIARNGADLVTSKVERGMGFDVGHLRGLSANLASVKVRRLLGCGLKFCHASFQLFDTARKGLQRFPNGNLVKDLEYV